MNRPPTPIAIAVVQDGERFLVGRRPDGVALAGQAEFPGGKVEAGESPAEAAVRECREEAGLDVEVLFEYPVQVEAYAHDVVELHFFACQVRGDPTRHAAEYRWVERGELAELPFPSGNAALLRFLA